MSKLMGPAPGRVEGYGPRGAKLVIVGEAPVAKEVQEGRPFVGAAGSLLRRLLHDVGINPTDVYMTNVVKEKPTKGDMSSYMSVRGKSVKTSEVFDQYVAELHEELDQLEPNLIVCLGNAPLYALLGKTGISKHRGSLYQDDKGRKILACLHPAGALRQYIWTHYIKLDLTKAAKEMQTPAYNLLERVIHLRPTFDEAMAYMESCKGGEYVSFDIEVLNLEMSCFALAKSPTDAMCIPLVGERGDYFSLPLECKITLKLSELLEDPDLPIWGQNLNFDASFLLKKYGIKTRNIEDTMVGVGIMYPDFQKGLDFITSVYTDMPYYKDEGKQYMKIGGSHEDFWRYNAKDVLAVADAFPKIREELHKLGNWETYQRQRDLIYPILCMEHKGILVDKSGLIEVSKESLEKIDKLTEEWETYAPGVNPRSTQQLKNYFYVQKGIKPYVNRKTGSATVDGDALKRLANTKHMKEASILLEIRKEEKLRGTYYEMQYDEDSHLRSTYNPVGTSFGRLSSSQSIFGTGGNFQNMPPSFKQYLISEPGRFIINIDKAKAENMVVAHIAPDWKMIEAFEQGTDLHSLTAVGIARVFGYNYTIEDIQEMHEKHEETHAVEDAAPIGSGDYSWRFWGKKANHSLNYGLGYKTFAFYYELPEKDSRQIVEGYHQTYPGVRQYHQWVQEALGAGRMLQNPFGRKILFLDRWDDALFKQAYSAIPQSTVADLVNQWGLLYWYNNYDLFKGSWLVNQVHDSIVLEMDASLPWKQNAEMIIALCQNLNQPIHWHGREFIIDSDATMGLSLAAHHPLNWKAGLDTLAQQMKTTYEVLTDEKVAR